MWVIPDTFLPSSLSAQDMVESKEDLTLLESSIASSLMWRSKPSPLRTWLQRWNRVSWTRLLFTRTLKPSRQDFFEAQLTSSLAAIRASRLARLGSDLDQKTRDTFGPSSARLSGSYDPDEFSSRMSKVTSLSGLTKSSATWKHEVTTRRGEYSQRLKSGHPTSESGSTSWPTVRTTDTHQGRGVVVINGKLYRPSKHLKAGKLVGGANLADAAQMWPTPSARDWKDTPGMAQEATDKSGKFRNRIDQLARSVYYREREMFPTPDAGAAKGRGATSASGRSRLGGALNPTWVEWLMGVPTGWTAFDYSETE